PYASDIYIGHSGASDVRVHQKAQRLNNLSIAPDGKHAVESLQIDSAPQSWLAYEDRDLKRIITASIGAHSDGEPTNLYQYFLIDSTTGAASPLTDAPAGWSAIQTPLWTHDGSKVIL